MERNTILRIKRTADQISTSQDINITNNELTNLARQVYFNHYYDKYNELELSLYQLNSDELSFDFIRDDGVIVFLQLVQNDVYTKKISLETIQTAMHKIGLKHSIVFTINLKPKTNINKITRKVLRNCYINITETPYSYNKNSIREKPESKKRKLNTRNCINTRKKNITKPVQQTLIKKVINSKDWISASKTRNYALKDTLIDWLDQWHHQSTDNGLFSERKSVLNSEDFSQYIMKKGINFENKVVELIKNKIEPDNFVTICSDMSNFYGKMLEYEKLTIDAIQKGIPIIYQPLLMNWTGSLAQTYGIPDMIIRSDYLLKLVEKNPLEISMVKKKAPKLSGVYHYVVVDIKFATIELCTDGKRIRNCGSVPAYKCQLYIYNHALGKIQGYEPSRAFILGRRYKYGPRHTVTDNNCFARLGHIEYVDWDKNYIDKTVAAVEWIRKLRLEGKEWTLFPQPSVPELYPNMCNYYENCWDNFKNEYANKIGEITLLWNCGVRNREIAHANGIYSYRDPSCKADLVGITGPKQSPILNAIIKINQKNNFKSDLDRIGLQINPEVDNIWTEKYKLCISVDFETISNVFDNLQNLPMCNDQNHLFMIGVGYRIDNEPVSYKMFMVTELSINAEFQMVYQLYKFLRKITDKYLGKSKRIPPLYHWGHMEFSFFSDLCQKMKETIGNDINKDIRIFENKIEWFDLSECFKSNPIVINGCFRFGLKEIAKRLYDLGLIKSVWNKQNPCSNGNKTMVIAHRIYELSKQQNIPVNKYSVIQDIIEYNRIDCIVIHEIIDLLQKKFSGQKSIRM